MGGFPRVGGLLPPLPHTLCLAEVRRKVNLNRRAISFGSKAQCVEKGGKEGEGQ